MRGKHIFSAIAFMAILVLTAASCAKDITPVIPEPEDTAQVFDLALRFDAPDDLAEAVVYFFDGHGQQVAVENFSIPGSTAEAVTASFLSETRPEYILTEGLQNVGDNGLLAIPNSSVRTRAGYGDSVLLVIR